ncbi:hypothetical protein C0Q70_12822 [Pomacea canaliculata]|uniref:Uncharacterized protein n=1 Tax=Pomacea canaliculata TaxID=400727 RepID=A0A2T7P2J7_POMCA|nr:hypothetical protein C0Q70_12822 [Pomacea canaliculata]
MSGWRPRIYPRPAGAGAGGVVAVTTVAIVLIVGVVLSAAVRVVATEGDLPNPRIVEHPTDDYVAKNEPAKLNCKAEGDPPPTITWYRNGERVLTAADSPSSHRMLLNSGQLFFLRIIHNKNAKPDVGVYYCNATNIHGSAISNNATLQLAVLRDDFRENPEPVTVAAGDSAAFHCKPPRGEPEPKVLWRKSGTPVAAGGRITATDEGDLLISSVQVTDAGDYTCLALNKGGERESVPATLTVLEKPTFRQAPDDVLATEDDTVELKCSATGDPRPTIQWQKEDGRIPFGRARQLDDGTLWIEKVQVSDDGIYVCMAENVAGTAKAVGRLTVHTMPSFLIKPSNLIVGKGRTATLQCVVTGNPPPTVFWSKGKEQHLMFPNQENGRFSVSEDGTFRIRDVEYQDEGQYVCQALNVLGSEKATATIEVRDDDTRPPPIIIMGPQNQTLELKEVAMLPCQATGDPPPVIRWYKDDRPLLGDDPRITILNSGTLQISDVRTTDTAVYTCKAISETGETSWKASLTAAKQGPFYRTPKPSAFPGPPSKVMVRDITDTSVHLSWQPNQVVGKSPVFNYIVEYFSHETPEGWVRASESVPRESYTVRNLKPETTYVFIVRAQNSFGLSEPSPVSDSVETRERRTSFAINMPREEIEKELGGIVVEIRKGEAVNSSVIQVEWEVVKGMATIEGFIVNYTHIQDMQTKSYGENLSLQVADPYKTSVQIPGLRSYAWYEICILAYARDVRSQCSTSIKVSTKESVSSSPPENIVIHKEDDTIHIRWSPPPKSQQNGDIKGYEVYCMDDDKKHNCSLSADDTTSSVRIQNVDGERTYRIRLAARTGKGVGVWSKTFVIGPEQTNIMKEPWFIGMLISTIGGTLWLALCIFSIWLCRKRKNKKKMAQNGMYSAVPVHKSDDSRSGMGLSRDDAMYSQKDPLGGLSGPTKDMDGGSGMPGGMYSVAGAGTLLPQMKTFYQKPSSATMSVAPYATTTLINTCGSSIGGSMQGKSLQPSCMDATFRPINHAYVHSSASGSGDSCPKPDMRSSDSNTDNSRPNTGHYSYGCPHDILDGLVSPSSDSSSLTTDENGMPIRRSIKGSKQVCPAPGKQPMVNWAELLPPPPEHPPPSDVGSPTDSPMNSLQRHPQACEAQRLDNNRSPISPVSKISACSCPVPHESMVHNMRGMPCYSDTEYTGGPPHGSRYPDYRPYSPKQLNMKTQSAMVQGAGGGSVRVGVGAPGVHGMHLCHMCPQPNYVPTNAGGAGQGMDTMMCPHHHSYHSDLDHFGPRPTGGPVSLHGYRMPPLEGGMGGADPRMLMSDSESMGRHMHMYQGGGGGMGEGPLMDRACQSSLPSLANECIHSPGYRSSRNAESPVSEGLPDYAGESDLDAARTTDCPTPESSVNGEGDGSVSGSMLADWSGQGSDSAAVETSSVKSSEDGHEADGHSSDSSFLTDADFASALARAAELSGMTVVGTTVTDPKAAGTKKYRKHRSATSAARPTSPYSTDSNFSAVVHKPYPKSERKKQLQEQARKYGSRTGTEAEAETESHAAPSHSLFHYPYFSIPGSTCSSPMSVHFGNGEVGHMRGGYPSIRQGSLSVGSCSGEDGEAMSGFGNSGQVGKPASQGSFLPNDAIPVSIKHKTPV